METKTVRRTTLRKMLEQGEPGQSVEYWGGYLDAINLALRFASGQSLEQIEALPVWKQIKAQGQLF
jgi:hypothetical protein